MGITTKQYVKKPLFVEAVCVTRRNFTEVVAWCEGSVQTEHPNHPQNPGKRYIKLEAHNPINTRQTKAYVGDWILKTERGMKVYSPKNFRESFEEVVEHTVSLTGSNNYLTADNEKPYPYEEGGFIQIGPQCFAAKNESVLNWKGVNYVRQDANRLVEAEVADFSEEDDTAIPAPIDPGVPQ
jgi:hypothetical protein